MAERILIHRKENGPFTDPEQLMDVSGIGEKKYDRMKPFIRVR
jgi:competence protein ComEA